MSHGGRRYGPLFPLMASGDVPLFFPSHYDSRHSSGHFLATNKFPLRAYYITVLSRPGWCPPVSGLSSLALPASLAMPGAC